MKKILLSRAELAILLLGFLLAAPSLLNGIIPLVYEQKAEDIKSYAVDYLPGEQAKCLFPSALLREVNVTFVPSVLEGAWGSYFSNTRDVFVEVELEDGSERPFGEGVGTLGHELGHRHWRTRVAYDAREKICAVDFNTTDLGECEELYATSFGKRNMMVSSSCRVIRTSEGLLPLATTK